MVKKIFSIIMAAVTAASLAITALADAPTVKAAYSCKTWVYAYRQYSREFAVKTEYFAGADIITAGIQCLRVDTGVQVGTGELVSNKNSSEAEAHESILYVDCPQSVRACGSHSAYKNGTAVVFEFTQSKETA